MSLLVNGAEGGEVMFFGINSEIGSEFGFNLICRLNLCAKKEIFPIPSFGHCMYDTEPF